MQAEAIKEEFTQAAAEVQSAPPAAANKTLQKTGSAAVASKALHQSNSTSSAAATGTIDVIAVMLDPENNLVDILYPGDTVKFLVSTDKDAYIAIIGIDAKGNQYSLPVKDNFLKADMPRTFPDDDVDYQVVDGVFGSEHLFIFAASTPEGLPKPVNEGAYQPNTVLNAARGMVAVAKRKKLETGVFVIPYTVMKR